MLPDFQIGKAITLRDGTDVTLVSAGPMIRTAIEVAELLAYQGVSARVLDMHTIRPLDKDAILQAANETHAIFTMEEHSICGGLGSAISELLAELESPKVRLLRFGLEDCVHQTIGSQSFLLKTSRLTASDIVGAICRSIGQCT